MTKIKICGLSRFADIQAVNEAKPDYCGFVIDVPKSRRNVSPDEVKQLVQWLSPGILPIGVFVNHPVEKVAALLNDGTLSAAQLHGQENAAYLTALRSLTDKPIIQAFSVCSAAVLEQAEHSTADYILLDSGKGGTGIPFDWSLLKGFSRPFFLAGGLTPDNLSQAIRLLHPFAVDVSSGVETAGKKEKAKILAAVAATRSCHL